MESSSAAFSVLNNNTSPSSPSSSSPSSCDPTIEASTTSQTTTISSTTKQSIQARMVSRNELDQCGERLRQGDLVAFPTETVYGLGCHALDETAILKVFAAKERPLTDPLIVHVTDFAHACQLWDDEHKNNNGRVDDGGDDVDGVDDDETASTTTATTTTTTTTTTTITTGNNNNNDSATAQRVLRVLTDAFWPGPLTLVARANSEVVPSIVMAHTGYVACRCPQHALAQELLRAARIPIAAPSANKFGHVSPTRAQHVWDDLKFENVWIVNNDNNNNHHNHDYKNRKDSVSCEVGVESTVAKLTMNDNQKGGGGGGGGVVTVLRQGAISAQQLQLCLQQAGLSDWFTVELNTKRATADHIANVAPGQTIRHYSPNIPSYMVTHKCYDQSPSSDHDVQRFLSGAVIIDYGGKLKAWKSHALAYRDLSPLAISQEAAQNVFETLRWAETTHGGTVVLFPQLSVEEEEVEDDDNNNNNNNKDMEQDPLLLAVKDRLTRAASGVTIDNLQETMLPP